jgi:hypothetical protein
MLILALLLADASPTLAPLQFYTGHCWTTHIDAATTDTHCFSTVYGGAHIRDEHVVRHDGKSVYQGETLFSDEGGQLTFTYWNSLGGIGRGTGSAAGDDITFSLTMRATPASAPAGSSFVWHKSGDGYETRGDGVVRQFRQDG